MNGQKFWSFYHSKEHVLLRHLSRWIMQVYEIAGDKEENLNSFVINGRCGKHKLADER